MTDRMWWMVIGLGLTTGTAFGWMLRARLTAHRMERIRREVKQQIARQDQKKRERDRELLESTRHGIERWTTDRTERLIEEAIEGSAELAEKRREAHGE